MGMRMRNLVFVLFILFIFASPTFGGEKVERQNKKQFIVTSYSTCQHNCEIDLQTC